MAKRRWTVVLVPHGAEPSRIIEVSYSLLRLAATGLVVGLLLAFLVGYATLARSPIASTDNSLAHENAKLERELGDLQQRLATLSDTITKLSERDAKLRVLANLDPIDPQVRAVGIGGPATGDEPESRSTAVRRAHATRVDLNSLIRRANMLAESFRAAADSLSSHKARLAATPSIMPTNGWLTSSFSAMRSHPILHIARPHEGVDVSAPMGTPIEAPGAGRVVKTGWEAGYGNIVELDHGYGIRTKYAHTSKVLVRTGQRVERGDRIALVGNSGLATAPHLHYEVHVHGRPIDPLRYVLPENVVTD